ncbi:MAG TPA: hypothetical protein VF278_16510 [Pirellulales bacterium]
MKVTLAGPDDLGHWFLDDEHGNSFPLVERHEDHPAAATRFGWQPPDGATDDETILNALDWLMENIGEEIDAPRDVKAYFEALDADADAE